MMSNYLVIVPCGVAKIWRKRPEAGVTAAKDAYIGSPFIVNRAYAEKFGAAWRILSAKYGLIEPEFMIPGPYEVTFKQKRGHPISYDKLREQVQRQRLTQFSGIIGLGGTDYSQAVKEAFAGTSINLHFPFLGLYPVGVLMQRVKAAIALNDPFWIGSKGPKAALSA